MDHFHCTSLNAHNMQIPSMRYYACIIIYRLFADQPLFPKSDKVRLRLILK